MADVDLSDIIEFMQHLKKGFDKDLFQSKIEELAHVAETTGIESNDFHNLFKLWLNLSIPITKWISLGACLVPKGEVEERTIDYAFRWLLANCEMHANLSRMAFLLDWLTAAMDCGSIDLKIIDYGYEIFFSLLTIELLTAHVLKLVYTLTKPSDVTRKKVIELLDYAKQREGKRNMLRQIQVLLGLFKSYKPECVPENVPAVSIHTSFKKINATMMGRFKLSQVKELIHERRQNTTTERHHLTWMNPLNSQGGRNRKADPLVPNVEFKILGSKQYTEKEMQKNILDFADPVSLLQYSITRGVCRPARLRALLCNQTGLVLLALGERGDQAFLAHDLHHLLVNCFLESSPHSYAEKADLLQRLNDLQNTLLQGVPVITRFLGQFLPFWNEKDYFTEILRLVEWVSVCSAEELQYIVPPLARAFHRAEPLQQCAILRALTNMYRNLVFSSTRERQHFASAQAPDYAQILPLVANSISDMCEKGLQVNPEDIRVLHSSLSAMALCGASALRHGGPLGPLPRALGLAVPLVGPTPAPMDKVAALLLLYRKIFSQLKAANKHKDSSYVQQRKVLECYTSDFLRCLYHENALSGRKSGLVFQKLHPQVTAKLADLIPDVDAQLSLRNSLAFSAYTYPALTVAGSVEITNKLCFDVYVSESFPNLREFLARAVPELR